MDKNLQDAAHISFYLLTVLAAVTTHQCTNAQKTRNRTIIAGVLRIFSCAVILTWLKCWTAEVTVLWITFINSFRRLYYPTSLCTSTSCRTEETWPVLNSVLIGSLASCGSTTWLQEQHRNDLVGSLPQSFFLDERLSAYTFLF